jgi:glycosyltransferase involved in cell wall biosynthesis
MMSWGSDILLHANRNAEWRRATEVALAAADGFFCDSDTVREASQRYTAIPETRIAQFPWGIRRGTFSPQGQAEPQERFGWESGSFIFIATRSWESLYRTDVLLRAFHLAYKENNSLRLLLLGDGSEAARVHRFIAEHELNQVVATPGLIASTETPRWFRAANTYVSCAASDGTSISLLEAMATGLPVVVTDIPSNREWIAEDKNGWLAATGSSEDFAAKLLLAASRSPGDLAAISARNQSVIAERADWDQNFPRLLRLYEFLAPSARVMRA